MLRIISFSALVLAISATAAFAQPGGGPGGGFGGMRMPASMLLIMPEVQKELQITDDQKSKLEDLRDEQQKNMQAAFSGFDFRSLQDLSDEERAQKMKELRAKGEKLSKQIDEKVGKILDTKQSNRLKQLQLQREGVDALNRPEIVTKLALTDEQKAKIKKIQDDGRDKGRPTFDRNSSPDDFRAALSKMRKARTKMLKDALAVLTDDQLVNWGELVGKEFKFPENGGFGRGGNRPGGNGPGGNPPTDGN